MNTVGIVTIAFGVSILCGRGTTLVAPALTLRWFKETIASNARIRMLGAFVMALGGAMVWAGTSEDSGLATFLTVSGWVVLVSSALVLVLFPGVYRAIANPFMPSDTSNFFLWRCAGLASVPVGVFIIYFGVLAL